MLNISFINQGCLFTSCFNGGSCSPEKEKQPFLCLCLPPWTGDRCEVRSGNPELHDRTKKEKKETKNTIN